jgi:flagellar protein FliO/FliZ
MKSILFTVLLIPSQIMAQQTADKPAAVDPVSSSYLIKLSIGLLVVVGLVFFLAWLVKKMQLVQSSNNGLIKIVSAISVGQRERIALIQVGDEQLLIGLTPGRIDKLHTLEKAIETGDQSMPVSSSFQQKFQQLLNKEKPDATN